MSLQHFGKGAIRVAKNYTKGYSDTQAKLRDATSNDPWGPSGTQMNEIAQLTFDQHHFVEIMEMLDKRLNDKGKNWRHVFKALTVLDYCLHAGSENVVLYFRDNIYIIKTLKEFQYIDEDMKDQGANVRQKAKDITNLLQDESRLREQRRSRAHMRDRMTGGLGGSDNGMVDEDVDNENVRRRSRSVPPAGANRKKKDDDDLKRAIEASKRTLEDERSRQGHMTSEDRDIAKALQLSKDEEAKRLKALEESNARALFDEGTQPAASTSANPFPLIDATSAPANPMNLQPQFTAANPYFQQLQLAQQQQQQQQQQQAQAEYEWMLQQQQQAQQQALLQQQQQQQQQEEWMRQQQMMQQQQQQQQLYAQQQAQLQQQQLFSPPPMQVQPTGYASNNPFAMAATGGPSMFGGGAGANGSAFNSLSVPSSTSQTLPRTPSPAPPQQQTQTPSPTMANTLANSRRAMNPSDAQHSQLASLFANRDDGVDSFGNTGQLRFGHQYASQLGTQPTGSTNPFGAMGGAPQQQQKNEQPFFSI